MKRLNLFNVLIITVIAVISMACQSNNEETEQDSQESNYQPDLPLVYHMAYMDRFSTKLYLAAQEENWELADIYAHELKEVSEVIVEGNFIDEDINRSQLLEVMLLPQLETIGQAIDAKDSEKFEQNYQTLINTCNQCHSAARYGLIKITIPTENPYNQDFSK